MVWFRSRYFLPTLMIPIFLLAFVRAELRWRDCSQDEGRVCFNYPTYLRYETRQALDVHWPSLLPTALLHQLPYSISPAFDKERQTPVLRYIVTVSSVVCFWYAVGLWWERLLAGSRLRPQSRVLRWSLLVLLIILTPLVVLSVCLGIRGGWEGPTMTDAGFLAPALLVSMGLVECLAAGSFRQVTIARVVLASLLLCLYCWADSGFRREHKAYQQRNKREAADPGAVGFTLPFFPSPEIQDALALQLPALLVGALPSAIGSLSSDSMPATAFRCLVVWFYWFTLTALPVGRWPVNTRAYFAARRPLTIACTAVFLLAFLAWIVAESAHGPTPTLGIAVGTGAIVVALHVSRKYCCNRTSQGGISN
jgi:hypothetical protein